MHISYIEIRNFRNFKELKVDLAQNAVVLGENAVGKSNFVHALRIVLDPTLPDSERKPLRSDFNYLCRDDKAAAIEITIRLQGIEHVEQQSVLYDCRNPDNPEFEVELSYRFAPIETTTGPTDVTTQYDFDFYCRTCKQHELQKYSWESSHRRVKNMGDIRKRIVLRTVPALRDIENALESWRRSPLRSLVERRNLVEDADFAKIVGNAEIVTTNFRGIGKIAELETSINDRLSEMLRGLYAVNARLGLTPADAGQLSQTIRIYTEGDQWRTVDTTSLGIANVIYLALLSTEMKEQQTSDNEFSILCVEEPEAHLHPHLQRLVFRDYFRELTERRQQVIVTTHSPNIASVAQISSLVLMRGTTNGSVATSTANIERSFAAEEIRDLARYLDVTRSDLFFAKHIVLVEGIAEELLLPAFYQSKHESTIKSGNATLDEKGVTVCNIEGVGFMPYVKLLKMIGTPFILLTDGDATKDEDGNVTYPGIDRCIDIAQLIDANCATLATEAMSNGNVKEAVGVLASIGLFCNTSTLEGELLLSGCKSIYLDIFKKAGARDILLKRLSQWIEIYITQEGQSEEAATALAEIIRRIEKYPIKSKGRFAQLLSMSINYSVVPPYFASALEFIEVKFMQ